MMNPGQLGWHPLTAFLASSDNNEIKQVLVLPDRVQVINRYGTVDEFDFSQSPPQHRTIFMGQEVKVVDFAPVGLDTPDKERA